MLVLAALALLTRCGDAPTPVPSESASSEPTPPTLTPPDFLSRIERTPRAPRPPLGPPVEGRDGAGESPTHWVRQEGGADEDRLHALATDATGGFVAVGLLGERPFPTGTGFALARYAADGTPVWTRQVTTASVRARAVALTGEGGIIVAGSYDGAPDLGGGPLSGVSRQGAGFFLARFSAWGALEWSHGFVATEPEVAHGPRTFVPVMPEAVATDSTGGVVVVGRFQGEMDLGGRVLFAGEASLEGANPSPGGFIARFSWRGSYLWSRVIEAVDAEPQAGPRTVRVTPEGMILVGGRVGVGANLGDGALSRSAPFIAEYDSVGGLVWKWLFLGDVSVQGTVTALQPLSSGSVAFIANLGGAFVFKGRAYTGGAPGELETADNLSGFAGTLRARGEEGWLLDTKQPRLLGLAATASDALTVMGLDETHAPVVTRVGTDGAPVGSRLLDRHLLGEGPASRLLLAPQSGERILLGGDFQEPLLHEGVAYAPRGASDVLFLQLGP